MITGEIGLTFTTVQYDGIYPLILWRRKLNISGKGRSSQANDARVSNDLSYLIGMEFEIIIIMPNVWVIFVFSIRFNSDC